MPIRRTISSLFVAVSVLAAPLSLGVATADPSGAAPTHGPLVIPATQSSTALSVGYSHSCTVSSGAVRCWGSNAYGELGNGSLTPSPVPVTTTGLAGARAVVAASFHTCALLQTRKVSCWGDNSYGQLAAPLRISHTTLPRPVPGIADVTALTTGTDHTCALERSGSVLCWGDNSDGQLGDGTRTIQRSPVAVQGLSGVTAIAASAATTCAITASTLWCWGGGTDGQLGQLLPFSVTPVEIGGLHHVTRVALSAHHVCALDNTGTLDCWGNNAKGQLGDGTTRDSVIPVVTTSVPGVTALALGDSFSCVLAKNARTWCWGDNSSGQLATGTVTDQLRPARSLVPPATHIAAGFSTAAVISTAASHQQVIAWGSNASHQLGR